ncbi:hypothetical protein TGPRC2_311760 [Toxoplasma gondii TgCatPRC2]|uniref:Uncharacterized protein n=1 Tax=Toxoplasma gondii TgCatPRC2 TaxID=1130821 RepID=A0A151HKK3_TOXGO|nr:hypothetical protein TGPRC2_311760 [Toxoplasma gondii TgCatPRC2]
MPRVSQGGGPGADARCPSSLTSFAKGEAGSERTLAPDFEGKSALRSSSCGRGLQERQDAPWLSLVRPSHVSPFLLDERFQNVDVPCYELSSSPKSSLAQTPGGVQSIGTGLLRHPSDSRDGPHDEVLESIINARCFVGVNMSAVACTASQAEAFSRRGAAAGAARVSLRRVPGASKLAVEDDQDDIVDTEEKAGGSSRHESETSPGCSSTLKKDAAADRPLAAGKSRREISAKCLLLPFFSASVDLASRAIIHIYTAAAKGSTGASTHEAEGRDPGQNIFMWIERKSMKLAFVRSKAYGDFRTWYCAGTPGSECSDCASLGAKSPLSTGQRMHLSMPEIIPPVVKTSFGGFGAGRVRAGPPHQWTWKGEKVMMPLPPKELLAPRNHWRRAGTDDGRLEGWTEEQLEVRVVVRRRPAAGIRGCVRRMSKKVTFSLDTADKFSRDGDEDDKQSLAGSVSTPASDFTTGHLLGGDGSVLRTGREWREDGRLSRRSSSAADEHGRRSSRSMSRNSDTSQDGTLSSSSRQGRPRNGSRRRRGLSPLPLLLDLLGEDEPLLSRVVLEPQLDGNEAAGSRPNPGAGGSGWDGDISLAAGSTPGGPSCVSRGLYHPLDRPETLFPQARARHLRRQFCRHRSAPGGSPLSWPALSGEFSKCPGMLLPLSAATPQAQPGVRTAPTSCSSSDSAWGVAENVVSGSETVSLQLDAVLGPRTGRKRHSLPVWKQRADPAPKGPFENRPSRLSRFLSHWKLSSVTTMSLEEPDPPPASAAGLKCGLMEADLSGRQVMELSDILSRNRGAESGTGTGGGNRRTHIQLGGLSEREAETDGEWRRFSEEASTTPRTREGSESTVSRTPRHGGGTDTSVGAATVDVERLSSDGRNVALCEASQKSCKGVAVSAGSDNVTARRGRRSRVAKDGELESQPDPPKLEEPDTAVIEASECAGPKTATDRRESARKKGSLLDNARAAGGVMRKFMSLLKKERRNTSRA